MSWGCSASQQRGKAAGRALLEQLMAHSNPQDMWAPLYPTPELCVTHSSSCPVTPASSTRVFSFHPLLCCLSEGFWPWGCWRCPDHPIHSDSPLHQERRLHLNTFPFPFLFPLSFPFALPHLPSPFLFLFLSFFLPFPSPWNPHIHTGRTALAPLACPQVWAEMGHKGSLPTPQTTEKRLFKHQGRSDGRRNSHRPSLEHPQPRYLSPSRQHTLRSHTLLHFFPHSGS